MKRPTIVLRILSTTHPPEPLGCLHPGWFPAQAQRRPQRMLEHHLGASDRLIFFSMPQTFCSDVLCALPFFFFFETETPPHREPAARPASKQKQHQSLSLQTDRPPRPSINANGGWRLAEMAFFTLGALQESLLNKLRSDLSRLLARIGVMRRSKRMMAHGRR